MSLSNKEKKEISTRYHEKNETIEDIAKAMNTTPKTVSKYKDYVEEKESASSETTKETATTLSDEERLDAEEMLDKIILEASVTKKRGAIVRMVARTIGKDEESVRALNDGLRIGGVIPSQRNLILRNWAEYLEVEDYEEILKNEAEKEKKKSEEKKEDLDPLKKKEGEKKTEEEKKKESMGKTPVDPVKEVFKKYKVRKAERLENLMNTREIAEMEREMGVGKEEDDGEEKHTLIVDGVSLKLTASEMLSWKHYLMEQKKEEEEREERKEERKQQTAERQRLIDERRPQNDGGLVEWVIGEGTNAKTIKVRPETIPLLIQAQGVKNNLQEPQLSKEEVTQIVERGIEAQTKNLTSEDVERIVQHAVSDQPALTKGDLIYLEARDKLHLEEKKLDESGKTRDVISGAITDGFKHAGNIVGRMMTEEGSAAGSTPVSGYSNQEANMMQIPCPGCNAVMTAPINSPVITCIGCGKRWNVEQPPPKTDEFTPEEKKVIEKSMEDAKEGRIEPLETSEPTTDASKIISDPTTDATGVEKIAENIAIGEAAKKLEEEAKKKKELEELRQRHEEENERKREIFSKKVEETIKESPVEKKPWPKIDSNICPICKKKCKSKLGVGLHIQEVHPEYKK